MQTQTEKQNISNAVNSCEQQIEGFISELSAFREALKQRIQNYPESEALTAFAIYRKDKRTDRMIKSGNTSNGKEVLTEKQRKYLEVLKKKGKIDEMSDEEIAKLTKVQASELISKADDRPSADSISSFSDYTDDEIRKAIFLANQAIFNFTLRHETPIE